MLVGVALLAAIATRIDFSQLTVRWGLPLARSVAVAAAIMLAALLVSALRWRVILGHGAPRLPYMFRLNLIANFFGIFVPSAVGGDAVRGIAIGPSVGGRMHGLVGVFLDRMAGVWALLVYLALGVALAGAQMAALGRAHWSLPSWTMRVATLAVLAVAVAAAFVVVRRFARARETVRAGRAMVTSLVRSPSRLAFVALASLVAQGAYVVAWMVLASGFGFHVPWATFLLCVSLVSFGSSSLGVREGAWLLLFAPFGIPRADVLVFSLSYFAAFVVVGAIGGVLFLASGLGDGAADRAAG